LARNRLDAGNVASDLSHPRRVLKLAGRRLKAQVELLLLELHELVIELILRHCTNLAGFHRLSSSALKPR
jgi:hypothetical protein